MTSQSELLAELDALPTEELRQRAFAAARERLDVAFFWSVVKHLPHADNTEELDASLGAVGASVDDAVALWREFTGHGYGESEPLLRAAFIDYLIEHR
jgi:alkylhydroperoxidase family enzyme